MTLYHARQVCVSASSLPSTALQWLHVLKIVLKGKKIDTAEYDRVTAGHFRAAMLLYYSCTEVQTDGCSRSVKCDGLHYDRVTCIRYSSLSINYGSKHVSSASVFFFE